MNHSVTAVERALACCCTLSDLFDSYRFDRAQDDMFVCEGRATYSAAFDALSASAVRDPTNDRGPAPGHVFTSRGREYSDVRPLDGLYGGGQDFDSHAEVVVTRLR